MPRLLRPRLHVGLVDLHDVGAGGEQVLDLVVDRGGVVERHLLLVLVEIVLRLLRHGEGAGHRDLDRAVGVGAQELHVAHFDRMLAPDLADDARHRIGMAGAVERGAGIVDVDAFERGGEAVGVALAAHLAVGDDVEAGALLVADREQRRVVLRLRREIPARRATVPSRARAAESGRRASRGRSASPAARRSRPARSAAAAAASGLLRTFPVRHALRRRETAHWNSSPARARHAAPRGRCRRGSDGGRRCRRRR